MYNKCVEKFGGEIMKKHFLRVLSWFMIATVLAGLFPLAIHTSNLEASAVQEYKTGDIIQFGNYPQSEVTNYYLIDELNNVEKNWVSYEYYCGTGNRYDGNMKPSDYMKYADFFHKGIKYRAVYFGDFRPIITGWKLGDNSWQRDFYVQNEVYYYIFEPLKWKVLSPKSGLIMCDSIIDSQPFNNLIYKKGEQYYQGKNSAVFASDYEKSYIRAWLNQDFYNTAFSNQQKNNIKKTTIDNKCLWSNYSQDYNSNPTTDYVFLLSDKEATSTEYGFLPSQPYAIDNNKQLYSTEYAYSQGITCAYYSSRFYPSIWMLRTAIDSRMVSGVWNDGRTSSSEYSGSCEVGDTSYGIVPAMCLLKIKDDTSLAEQKDGSFHKNNYIADIWLNQNGRTNTSESVLINNIFSYKSISSEMYYALQSDGKFKKSVNAWEIMEGVFNPVTKTKQVLNEKDIYETLILDLLEKIAISQNKEINSIILDAVDLTGEVSGKVTKYKGYIDNFVKLVDKPNTMLLQELKKWKFDPNCASFQNFYTSLNNIGDQTDKWTDNKFIEGIGAIAEVSGDVADFYKRFTGYVYAYDMSSEMKVLLSEMHRQSDSAFFKEALFDVINAVDDATYASVMQTCELGTDLGLDVIDAVFGEISKGIPVYNALRLGYQAGVAFDNLVLNTSKIIDKYHLLRATTQFMESNKKSINVLADKYVNSHSETDAGAYIYGVKAYHYAYVIDLESAVSFAKAASEEGLYNVAKNGCIGIWNYFTKDNKKTSYQEMIESKESIENSLNSLFDSLDYSWIFNEDYLINDYPDVYNVFLTEELSKDTYNTNVKAYIAQNGKTLIEWSVPCLFYDKDGEVHSLYANPYINGVTATETIGSKKTTLDYSIVSAPNPIEFNNVSMFTSFPKAYTISSYSTSSGNKVYTNSVNCSLKNPLITPELQIPTLRDLRYSKWKEGGISIGIIDHSRTMYTEIKYDIYRKTDSSGWSKIGSVTRTQDALCGVTVFTDKTANKDQNYTYKVQSSLTFGNGITLTSNYSKEFCIKNAAKEESISEVRSNRFNSERPFMTTYSVMSSKADETSSSSYGVELSWDAVADANEYEVYRISSYGNAFLLIGTVNTTTYRDYNIENGVDYGYIVCPVVNNNGNKTYDVGVSFRGEFVNQLPTVKSVSIGDVSLNYKSSATIIPTITADEGASYTVTYTSSNPSVATVDNSGKVTSVKQSGLNRGSTVITSTVTDSYGNTVTDTCTVTVQFTWWQWLIKIALFGWLWY